MFEGQVICGGSVSRTITVKLQLLELPQSSVAETLTVFVPFANSEPEGGEQTTVVPEQASLAVAANSTIAEHLPRSVPTMMSSGQVTSGATVSTMVMVCEEVAVLPHSSVAVQVRSNEPVPPHSLDCGPSV